MTAKRQLRPTARKTVLAAHVVTSVAWLGLTLGNLVLAITGISTTDGRTQQMAYLAMGSVANSVLVPVALAAVTTGLVLSLATPWGLFTFRWVAVKFWLSAFAMYMTPFSLLPGLNETVDLVRATPPGTMTDLQGHDISLLSASCVSLTIYTVSTLVSVYKPWGRSKGRLTQLLTTTLKAKAPQRAARP